MLSNNQSLILTGFLAGSIFVFGILDILDNFVVLTGFTLVFLAIIINLIYTISKVKVNPKNQDDINKKASL